MQDRVFRYIEDQDVGRQAKNRVVVNLLDDESPMLSQPEHALFFEHLERRLHFRCLLRQRDLKQRRAEHNQASHARALRERIATVPAVAPGLQQFRQFLGHAGMDIDIIDKKRQRAFDAVDRVFDAVVIARQHRIGPAQRLRQVVNLAAASGGVQVLVRAAAQREFHRRGGAYRALEVGAKRRRVRHRADHIRPRLHFMPAVLRRFDRGVEVVVFRFQHDVQLAVAQFQIRQLAVGAPADLRGHRKSAPDQRLQRLGQFHIRRLLARRGRAV